MSERITNKGKAVIAGVAALALAGVMHNTGNSQPTPERSEPTTAIYEVGKNDKTIGGIAEKIAAEGSVAEVAEFIQEENGDSTVIQPNQRLEVPVDLLDEAKTDVVTKEAPRNEGYNSEGELDHFGGPQEMQFVTLDTGSKPQS